jgi:LacI family transcriptional regulator
VAHAPRITLKDVAALAGVSIKTASRALAGEPGVNVQTLATIKSAAKKLDYRPNRLAQQLRGGQTTHAMALLIGELHNPFYSEVAAGVESVLRPHGFDIFIASTNEDVDTEKHLIENFIERSVEGILILPASQDHFYLENERQRGTPIIFLDRPPVNVLADSVTLDNRKATQDAIEYLFDEGHKNIAVLADAENVWTARERVIGVRDAYNSKKIQIDESLIINGVTALDAILETLTRLLALPKDRAPTAILALNNQITIGVISALQKLKQPLGLVGFDDFDLAEVLSTTVVRHSPFELGRQGALLALDRLENPNRKPSHIVMQAELVDRGSVFAIKQKNSQ